MLSSCQHENNSKNANRFTPDGRRLPHNCRKGNGRAAPCIIGVYSSSLAGTGFKDCTSLGVPAGRHPRLRGDKPRSHPWYGRQRSTPLAAFFVYNG